MNQSPFTPGITVASATIGATQTLTLGAGGGALGTPQVLLTLAGTTPAIAFYKFGSSSVTATTGDTPILPNTQVCITPPAGTTSIAVVGTAGTLWVTTGHGIQ